MRAILISYAMLLKQIRNDGMLVAVSLASVLAGFFFRFAVPSLERILCSYLAVDAVLKPYYRLFDLLLILLAPYMLCFAAAMVMLDEHEQGLTRYLSVTPLQTRGYLISRLGLPAGFSALVSMLLIGFFRLTPWNVFILAGTSMLSSLCGFSVSLFLFSCSRNKVEGMAMGKLSGILLIGLPVPFFLHSSWQYMFSLLPSYWLARYALQGSAAWLIASLLTSLAGMFMLYRRVVRKLV